MNATKLIIQIDIVLTSDNLVYFGISVEGLFISDRDGMTIHKDKLARFIDRLQPRTINWDGRESRVPEAFRKEIEADLKTLSSMRARSGLAHDDASVKAGIDFARIDKMTVVDHDKLELFRLLKETEDGLRSLLLWIQTFLAKVNDNQRLVNVLEDLFVMASNLKVTFTPTKMDTFQKTYMPGPHSISSPGLDKREDEDETS